MTAPAPGAASTTQNVAALLAAAGIPTARRIDGLILVAQGCGQAPRSASC